MELIAKIGTQQRFLRACNIKKDLYNFGSAEFSVELLEGVSEFQSVQIFEVTNTDTLIFEGFVSNFVVEDFMTITASEQKALLFSKLVRGDKEYTSEPCNQILQDVINNWNSFSGDNLTLNSNVTQSVNKSYKDGDNLYDILVSLASETESKWTMVGRQIIFRDIIGTERDFNAIYNPLEPTATNIASVRLENYGTQANIVVGSDGTTKNNKRDFSLLSERVAIYEMYREGDLDTQIQKTLDERKIPQQILQITLQTGFDFLEIGDTIGVIIENLDSYRNYNGNAIVNTISIRYENGSKLFTAGVSDTIVKKDDFIEKLRDITRNQRLSLI